MANEQGRTDHVANTMPSPYYHFDGSGDQINLGDSAILDMYDGEISFSAIVKLEKTGTQEIVRKEDGSQRFLFSFQSDSVLSLGTMCAAPNSADWYSELDVTFNQASYVGKNIHCVATHDKSGNRAVYVNGVMIGSDTVNGGVVTGGVADIIIGAKGGAEVLEGEFHNISLWNKALTADEVKELYSGASVPFKYKGASQTNIVDAGADVFTSGTYTWTPYGTNTVTNVSNQLVITFGDSMGGAYWYLRNTNDLTADLIVGKSYRFSVDAKYTGTGSPYLHLNTVDGVIADYSEVLTSTMTRHHIDFIATTGVTNWVRTAGMSAGVTVVLDNISLTQIGAVAEYDGSSATTDVWYDKSGNGLDGTVTGATLENRLKALEIDGSLALRDTAAAPTSLPVMLIHNPGNTIGNGSEISFSYGGDPKHLAGGGIGSIIEADNTRSLIFNTAGSNSNLVSVGNTEGMRLKANGNVGIGTATPGNRFVVYSDTTDDGILVDILSKPRIILRDRGNSDTVIGTGKYGLDDLYIDTHSGNALAIDGSTRRVGIGTTSPADKLQVIGTVNANNLKLTGIQDLSDYVRTSFRRSSVAVTKTIRVTCGNPYNNENFGITIKETGVQYDTTNMWTAIKTIMVKQPGSSATVTLQANTNTNLVGTSKVVVDSVTLTDSGNFDVTLSMSSNYTSSVLEIQAVFTSSAVVTITEL
jgi:hypothetical protein